MQVGQLQREKATYSQAEQVASPISLGDSSTSQESPTATTPPVAPVAIPIPTDSQQRQPQRRRQDSIPPPRRRDGQPPASPKDTEEISELDPIAENAAKDNTRFTKRLIKLLEEFNKTVQATERDFNLAHNVQGGTIRMPGLSHHQAISDQEFRELIKGGTSTELRRFQEASMKVNQRITVSGAVTECQALR